MAILVDTDPRIAEFLADPSTITLANAAEITDALNATVGTGELQPEQAVAGFGCEFNFGDGSIWSVVASLLNIICATMTNLGEVLRAVVSSVFATLATFMEDLIIFFEGRIRRLFDSVEFAITSTITAVLNSFDFVVERIVNRLGAAVAAVVGTLDSAVRRIASFLDAAVHGVVNALGGSVDRIIAGLGLSVDQVIAKAAEVFNRVGESVLAVVTRATTIAGDATSRILSGVVTAVDSVADAAQEIAGAVTEGVASVINGLDNSVATIVGRVESGFTRLLDASTAVADTMERGIESVIGVLVSRSEATFANIGGALTTLIETLTGAAESGLGAVRSVIEDIPQALRELAGDAGELVTSAIGVPLANMGTIMVEQVEEFFRRMIDDLDVSPGRIASEFLESLGLPSDIAERFALASNNAMPITPFPFAIAVAFLVPLLIAQVAGTVMAPIGEQLSQEVSKKLRQAIVPPTDLIDGWFKGTLTEDRLRDEFALHGFGSERLDIILAAAQDAPSVPTHINAWLRGLITEADLDRALSENRVRPADIALLKQVVFFIPPVQDLISMAVREVFSPDIRTRFGLDEDFPTEFSTFARQQGVSEEWAKNYWAAHWVLPSLNQGFEMLHRRVITADDLDLLMRTQDVMPFWRENLKDIAFSPLTRVDVRRMHDLGLISEDDLTERYMDLGFNEANADMMKAFTVAFNQPESLEMAELEGLTRSTILGMFDDGTLDEDETREIMITLGLGAEATDLFIGQRLLERQRTERRDLIEGIIELATGAVIDLPEAQDSLARVGMTAIEIGLAVKRILESRDSRRRLPSIAELRNMQLAQIIDSPEWREAMGGHGFPDQWIDRIETLDGLAITKRDPAGVVGLV